MRVTFGGKGIKRHSVILNENKIRSGIMTSIKAKLLNCTMMEKGS